MSFEEKTIRLVGFVCEVAILAELFGIFRLDSLSCRKIACLSCHDIPSQDKMTGRIAYLTFQAGSLLHAKRNSLEYSGWKPTSRWKDSGWIVYLAVR